MLDHESSRFQPPDETRAMRYVVSFTILFCAVIMVWLAVPRFVGSVMTAPAFATLRAANRGEALPLETLEHASDALEAAAAWNQSGRLRSELGFLYLLQASKEEASPESRKHALIRSANNLKAALIRRPVQPHAWVRLAFVAIAHEGPSSRSAEFLDRSLDMGRYVGEVTVPRIDALLQSWPFLNARLRAEVGQQIRFAWVHEDAALMALAARGNHIGIIRQALQPLPDALDRFDQELARQL